MVKTSIIAGVAAFSVPYFLVLALQILTILSFYYNYKFYEKLGKGEATAKEVKNLTEIYYGLWLTSMVIVTIIVVAMFGIFAKIRTIFG